MVEDVVLALIDSSDSKQYIQRMKQRDPELGERVSTRIREEGSEVMTLCHGSNCLHPDGKQKMNRLRQH